MLQDAWGLCLIAINVNDNPQFSNINLVLIKSNGKGKKEQFGGQLRMKRTSCL
jgi:hypothetical protein